MMTDLDPRLTFDSFVVGPANRLAAAAARRAAESPGTSYNPLFLYSASGLGKSHILVAVAHRAEKVHTDFRLVYQTLEGYLGELASALQAGERESLQKRYQSLDLLLLDDIQFLTGQTEAQEMLLRTLDSMSGEGRQIVLASDRPPADINGLDARLLSRFSAGLIVDIGPPEYETRVAIIRKKVAARGTELSASLCEAIARFPFKNVRELQGGLNRILAIQDLEDREVTTQEVTELLGGAEVGSGDEFVRELTGEVAATVDEQEAPWRKLLRSTIEEAESRGFSTERLRSIMSGAEEPDDVEALVAEVRASLDRLEAIRRELDEVGNPWPEAALAVLQDPERLEEAEALLASARERVRPFPGIPEGPSLEKLPDSYPSLPVKAAHRLIHTERADYNPLYISCPGEARSRRLLAAVGRTFLADHPEGRVAFVSAADFAEDFIRALSAGVAGAWRERWWTAELLLLHGAQALSQTERAQDEFFHLFEALKRREVRIVLASDRPPSDIPNIDDRLRSRFEGGLVVEMEAAAPEVEEREEAAESSTPAAVPEPAAPEPSDAPPPEVGSSSEAAASAAEERSEGASGHGAPTPPATPSGGDASPAPSSPAAPSAPSGDGPGGVVLGELDEPVSAADLVPTPGQETSRSAPGRSDAWNPSPEKVVWSWPRLEDRLVEEPD